VREPSVEIPTQEIDRSIYVMPAFATFAVRDLDASTRWYTDGLGFIVLATMPGPGGAALRAQGPPPLGLVHLRRWRYQDILLVPGRVGPGGPRITFAAGDDDLAAIAARLRAIGAGTVEGPTATPWHTRDLVATDADGHVVVLTAFDRARPDDPAFSESVRRGYDAARKAERG